MKQKHYFIMGIITLIILASWIIFFNMDISKEMSSEPLIFPSYDIEATVVSIEDSEAAFIEIEKIEFRDTPDSATQSTHEKTTSESGESGDVFLGNKNIEEMEDANFTRNYVDCPENREEYNLSYVILQYINNTFYKWEEFYLGEDNYCIILQEPEYRKLTKEEAILLLNASTPDDEPLYQDPDDLPRIIMGKELPPKEGGYSVERYLPEIGDEIIVIFAEGTRELEKGLKFKAVMQEGFRVFRIGNYEIVS